MMQNEEDFLSERFWENWHVVSPASVRDCAFPYLSYGLDKDCLSVRTTHYISEYGFNGNCFELSKEIYTKKAKGVVPER